MERISTNFINKSVLDIINNKKRNVSNIEFDRILFRLGILLDKLDDILSRVEILEKDLNKLK